MKTRLLLTPIMLLTLTLMAFSQSSPVNKTKYKIVVQLVSGDTAVQRGALTQVHHALLEAPNSKIEVVCHSGGIVILQSSKTTLANEIKDLQNQGVQFAACANSMRLRKIDKSDIVPQAIIVPAGVIEIVDKQSKGWAYLKAGN